MSNPDRRDLYPSYENLSGSELLALTLSLESLTDTARKALSAELERRHIGEADVATYGREAARIHAREERWRKVRSLQLKSWIKYNLLWPLGAFAALVGLEMGVHYIVELMPGLGEREVELYGGVAQIAAGILFLAVGAFFILSKRGDMWARRFGGRALNSSRRANQRAKFHAFYCPARSRGAAGCFLGFSVLMVFYTYRASAQPAPREPGSFILMLGLLYSTAILVDVFFSLTCLRERIVLGLAVVGFLISFLRQAAPLLVAPYSSTIRESILISWVAASIVSLSLFKSALHAPPPGASHVR